MSILTLNVGVIHFILVKNTFCKYFQYYGEISRSLRIFFIINDQKLFPEKEKRKYLNLNEKLQEMHTV